MRAAWAFAIPLALAASPASAVIVTTGAGSAVPVPEASAAFESSDSLFLNPYLESGLRFQRVGLTLNNNGCGFGGCGFPYFSGNYFYGSSSNSVGGHLRVYSDAALFDDSVMYGIEFIAGSGAGEPVHYAWEAFLGATMVGQGAGETSGGTVLGFMDPGGFTLLNWTTSNTDAVSFDSSLNAPAIDDVRVTYTPPPATVPSPGMSGMLALGALGLAGMGRRRALG